MLKTTKTFKNKMKVYGKQLNILLGFGNTKLDKTHVKKLNLAVNGDLFTSVMRQLVQVLFQKLLNNIYSNSKGLQNIPLLYFYYLSTFYLLSLE